jgi:hypothetical protein
MANPARLFHRNLRLGANTPLPLEALLEVVRNTTSFAEAVTFHKMGFPLNICMAGVPWPQWRGTYPHRAVMPPLSDMDKNEDDFWTKYHDSFEEGFDGNIYIVKRWTDTVREQSVVYSLGGIEIAGDYVKLSGSEMDWDAWKPLDPDCDCILSEEPFGWFHRCWQKCEGIDSYESDLFAE